MVSTSCTNVACDGAEHSTEAADGRLREALGSLRSKWAERLVAGSAASSVATAEVLDLVDGIAEEFEKLLADVTCRACIDTKARGPVAPGLVGAVKVVREHVTSHAIYLGEALGAPVRTTRLHSAVVAAHRKAGATKGNGLVALLGSVATVTPVVVLSCSAAHGWQLWASAFWPVVMFVGIAPWSVKTGTPR